MRLRNSALAAAVAILLSVVPARAGTMTLNFTGTTGTGTSVDGTDVAIGTSLTITTTFETPAVQTDTGVGAYIVDSCIINLGGNQYTATDTSDLVAILTDPSYSLIPGYYLLAIRNNADGSGMAPAYTSASTTFDGASPSPTVFSTLSGFLWNSLTVATSDGDVIVAFDSTVDTSITASAVPEPASIASASVAIAAGLLIAARRHRAA